MCNLSLSAQGFISVLPGLEGEELVESLVKDYKTTTTLNYSDARDILFGIIDNNGDSLTCVYTGHTIYLDPQADPTQAAFMNGSSDGINTEHTYPQSMGAAFGNARSDMHHLFPTRTAVNSARGNNSFGDIEDNLTDQWYFQNGKQASIPFLDEIDLYSETSSDIFEPREDHKGDVARAMFYFYTMYKEEADNANATFFEDQKETLCQWHIADPVDDKEWDRNIKIADYQEGKVNPFIYDCTVATRSYCPTDFCLPTSTEEVSKPEVTIYPNPAYKTTTIQYVNGMDDGKLIVYSAEGKIVNEVSLSSHSTSYKLDASKMEKGIYYIKIFNSDSMASKILVVN